MNRRAPFHFAPAEPPCFEDSRLGKLLFGLFIVGGIIVCAIQFGLVMAGKLS